MYVPFLGSTRQVVQLTEDDCQYFCQFDDEGCQTTYSPKGSNKTKGSCNPKNLGGDCIDIPENCENCNEVVDCQAGQGNCKLKVSQMSV